MGAAIIDKYTILHFSVGIIFRYLGFNIVSLLIAHTVFEILENSKTGMVIINKYFKLWPGGKPAQDSTINSISDIFFSLLGWVIADKFIIYINLGWVFNISVLVYFWILEHYL